jgi:hypothetical protein
MPSDNSRLMVTGNEEAANNNARGHYTVDVEPADLDVDHIRKLLAFNEKSLK